MKLGKYPKKKTEFEVCPVCGLSRGVGSKYEYSHGPCMEVRAKTDGEKPAYPNHPDPRIRQIKVKHVEKATDNKYKKMYAEGNLPKWMFD